VLNPNDDLAVADHGRLLMYLDRPEEGLARVREAMRLNPTARTGTGTSGADVVEASAAFDRINAPQLWVEAYLAACHAMCGRDESARHHVQRLYEMRPDFRLNTLRRALPYRNTEILERFLDTFRRAVIQDCGRS
jgi:adenylate cyclase